MQPSLLKMFGRRLLYRPLVVQFCQCRLEATKVPYPAQKSSPKSITKTKKVQGSKSVASSFSVQNAAATVSETSKSAAASTSKTASQVTSERTDAARSTTETETNENKSESEIETISSDLHKLLFPHTDVPACSSTTPEGIVVPPLLGNDLRAHFMELGSRQTLPYSRLLDSVLGVALPPQPTNWRMAPGWTCYDTATGGHVTIDYPPDDALFFDVETCVPDGQGPVLAVAASPKAWYSWCSRRLVDPTVKKSEHYRISDMIPLGNENRERIVVGHNVAYDRARVREQYDRKPSKMRFWDTMSMQISMFGMGDRQHINYQMQDSSETASKLPYLDKWREGVCKNSLAECHQFHCRDKGLSQLELDKSDQQFFVKNELSAVRENFQRLVDYCANDVQATFEVFQQLHPKFKERCPHPVTWFGMMEICTAYLPITDHWREFSERAEETCTSGNNHNTKQLVQLAVQLMEQLGGADERFKQDPWLWCEDWAPVTKTVLSPKWFKTLCKGLKAEELKEVDAISSAHVALRSNTIPRLFGLCWNNYPLHHMSKYGWGYLVPDPHADIKSLDKFVTLRRGDKVHFPLESVLDVVLENYNRHDYVMWIDDGEKKANVVRGVFPGFIFVKLPHPDGKEVSNVGNPLSKPFHKYIEDGTLWATRHASLFRQMADRAIENSYWISSRSRVNDQLTVWFDDENKHGAIVPTIIPAGTVTRRAVEKLWLTASNPKKNRVGSELKSMVEAPPGFVFVGADVDSQEQWVAAVLGDSYAGEGRAGSTPFSRMLLTGRKEDGSDLHSVVARDVGISRDHAKTLNYARLYGSGVQHTQQFLKENIDANRRDEVVDISHLLFKKTKGIRMHFRMLHPELNNQVEFYLSRISPDSKKDFIFSDGRHGLPMNKQGATFTFTEASQKFIDWFCDRVLQDSSMRVGIVQKNKVMKQMFSGDKPVALWLNGYESEVFNCLEKMADNAEPRTPVLGCQLSDALVAPQVVVGRDQFLAEFKRTRVNWVVQSSAVDFLHLLLSSMSWLCAEYDIDARFAISIHDEIRYLVAEKDKYRCALALQLSNLYVRAMVSHSLEINQLPKSVAFFSKVDVDRVLRKEVDMESVTLSNPDGMTKGYGISPGEALSLEEIAQKTGGALSKTDNQMTERTAVAL